MDIEGLQTLFQFLVGAVQVKSFSIDLEHNTISVEKVSADEHLKFKEIINNEESNQ